MTHNEIIYAAQKFGFEYHEDTTRNYQLLAPGVRIRGTVGQKDAESGRYSQASNSNNSKYLHAQVIVALLNGKSPQEMIETDANAERQEIIRQIASL